MASYYGSPAINEYINIYLAAGGEAIVLREGLLLEYGAVLLHGPGLNNTIIEERYITSWTSAYSVVQYDEIPAEYKDMMADGYIIEHELQAA